jgi:hypothetical protein
MQLTRLRRRMDLSGTTDVSGASSDTVVYAPSTIHLLTLRKSASALELIWGPAEDSLDATMPASAPAPAPDLPLPLSGVVDMGDVFATGESDRTWQREVR